MWPASSLEVLKRTVPVLSLTQVLLLTSETVLNIHDALEP